MAKKNAETPLEEYRKQVDEQMKYFYGIDWNDTGAGDELLKEAIEEKTDAREFVLQFGEKNDLDQISYLDRKNK